MEIKKAVRHSIPMIMSISGVSGSGKTYSALLLAAGLAGPGGKIGFLDTENGRGSMYADSPGIVAAIPQGYDSGELTAPFSPARYIEAIDAFERAGYNVLVIDSGSHEWEGQGGCSDIAEADKGRWNKAKLANKRYVTRLLNSSMHIIVCLRARDKSKIIDKRDSPDGKEHIIPLGILPISEKNFPYEMMLSFAVEEGTHLATGVKVPEQFEGFFGSVEHPKPKRLTKADGEAIRAWNIGAPQFDPHEKLKRRARLAAEDGLAAYQGFYEECSLEEKAILRASTHEENKQVGKLADESAASEAKDQQ
jgi:hypothetical protein